MKKLIFIFLLFPSLLSYSQTFQWLNKFENCNAVFSNPDNSGNTYAGAWFTDTAIIANVPLQFTESYYHLCLAKFDSSGNMVWMKSSDSSTTYARIDLVTSDDSGNIFLSGTFIDSVRYCTDTLHNNDFIIKYNSNGSLLWMHRFLGSIGCDRQMAIQNSI